MDVNFTPLEIVAMKFFRNDSRRIKRKDYERHFKNRRKR